jgi:hypothetical protein
MPVVTTAEIVGMPFQFTARANSYQPYPDIAFACPSVQPKD